MTSFDSMFNSFAKLLFYFNILILFKEKKSFLASWMRRRRHLRRAERAPELDDGGVPRGETAGWGSDFSNRRRDAEKIYFLTALCE